MDGLLALPGISEEISDGGSSTPTTNSPLISSVNEMTANDERMSAEKAADLPSPSILAAAAASKRSKRRQSILPANLKAIRESVAQANNMSDSSVTPVDSPERSASVEGNVPPVAVAVDNRSFCLGEPIAKRLRTRGVEKPAYNFKPPRFTKKSRSVSVESQSPSLPPPDSPMSDVNFSGAPLRPNAVPNVAPAAEAPLLAKGGKAGLKGILKRGVAVSSKHLAFTDEDVEARQALAESRRVEVESVPAAPSIQKMEGLIPGRTPNVSILSWNIAGLRAFLEKHTWREINALLPDVICLQEIKVQSNDLFETLGVHVGAVNAYFHHSTTKGHAGVAILSKLKPLQVIKGLTRSNGRDFAGKGHVITAEYPDFYLVNAYVPNSSAQLKNLNERLEWDKDFRAFILDLQSKKPVVLAGDLNCALKEIDLSNPARNQKNAGFTPQERASLALTMEELKLTDVFRQLNPDMPGCYTFWSTRSNSRPKNIGWRLDYFLVSEPLMAKVCGVRHFVDVMGSDHCPIMLYLEST